MFTVQESDRTNPAEPTCVCGNMVQFVIHKDVAEGVCLCGKRYAIKVGPMFWNCCSKPEND